MPVGGPGHGRLISSKYITTWQLTTVPRPILANHVVFFSYPHSPIVPVKDNQFCGSNHECFDLTIQANTTMLEAYNCDRNKPGQKTKVMPAEKQIYRADYVKQHFVHYSTVTESTLLTIADFKQKFGITRQAPDPLSRFGDEVTEGLMIHRYDQSRV